MDSPTNFNTSIDSKISTDNKKNLNPDTNEKHNNSNKNNKTYTEEFIKTFSDSLWLTGC